MSLSGRERDLQRLPSLIVASLQKGKLQKKLWQFSPLSQGPNSFWVAERLTGTSVSFQLRTIYKSFPEQLQVRFQQAVVTAVDNWDLVREGPIVLEGLSLLVADTKALDAIRPIGRFVESNLITNRGQERFRGALTASVGVIEGATRFDKTRETARMYLERWLENPDFEQYLSAVVNGLCRCSPDNYPSYLKRLLDVAGNHPDYFELDSVIRRLVKIVTSPIIVQYLDDLPTETQKMLEDKI